MPLKIAQDQTPAFFHLFYILGNPGRSMRRFCAGEEYPPRDKRQTILFYGKQLLVWRFVGLQPEQKDRLHRELDFMLADDVTNLRVLVGVEGEGQILGTPRVGPALQPGQGKFNSAALRSLDYLLAEMGRRNMKAVLFLSNNREWSGGFLQYLNRNGLIADSVLKRKITWDETRDYVSLFYGSPGCVADYKKQLQLVVHRTNTVTQKKYSDDTAIMRGRLQMSPGRCAGSHPCLQDIY